MEVLVDILSVDIQDCLSAVSISIFGLAASNARPPRGYNATGSYEKLHIDGTEFALSELGNILIMSKTDSHHQQGWDSNPCMESNITLTFIDCYWAS